ncbi:MAG: disulfide oxidoreductase [Actinomycetota bacterium]
MEVETFSRFFALLTIAVDLVALGLIGLMVAARFNERAATLSVGLKDGYGGGVLWFAWSIALTATLGSLYYSEVAGFTPCKLCWYQRIAMYPLVVVLGIAAVKFDHRIRRYVLPIVSIGALISSYHYLLERFPSWESGASCDPVAPCSVTWVWEFHFISIPFMALSGFAAIGALLLWGTSKEA